MNHGHKVVSRKFIDSQKKMQLVVSKLWLKAYEQEGKNERSLK